MAKKTTATNNGKATTPPRKTGCPITRAEFISNAEPITITVNGSTITLDARSFSTGSFGWFANGKVKVNVGDEAVPCQFNVTVTAIGSKEAN